MGRTPEDVALLLDVQAGLSLRDPHGFEHTATRPQLEGDITGMKIGWLGDWGGGFVMEPGVLEQCEDALKTFSDLGAEVVHLAPPFPAEQIWDAWVALRAWANAGGKAALYEAPEMRAQLKADCIWEIETGMALSAMDVHRASLVRTQWYHTLCTLFETYDALVMPSAQMWPFDVTWSAPQDIAGQPMDTYHRWMETVIAVSLVGVPSLNVPVGFSQSGLPMGMQVFGPRYADARVLRIGARWHEATPWKTRRPDLGALAGKAPA